jgi:hypothetical protein
MSANLNSSCWSVLQLPKNRFWITSGLPTILKVDGDKRFSGSIWGHHTKRKKSYACDTRIATRWMSESA